MADSVLAFVDVLGFEKLVLKLETDATAHAKVGRIFELIRQRLDLLNQYQGIRSELREVNTDPAYPVRPPPYYDEDIAEQLGYILGIPGDLANRTVDLAAQSISDAIVIYGTNNEANTRSLLALLLKLTRDMLRDGILLRGAVVTGPLYQNSTSVYGKALIDAYQAERSMADYPRILVPPAMAARIGGDLDGPLPRDKDGLFYLNPFVADPISLGYEIKNIVYHFQPFLGRCGV